MLLCVLLTLPTGEHSVAMRFHQGKGQPILQIEISKAEGTMELGSGEEGIIQQFSLTLIISVGKKKPTHSSSQLQYIVERNTVCYSEHPKGENIMNLDKTKKMWKKKKRKEWKNNNLLGLLWVLKSEPVHSISNKVFKVRPHLHSRNVSHLTWWFLLLWVDAWCGHLVHNLHSLSYNGTSDGIRKEIFCLPVV